MPSVGGGNCFITPRRYLKVRLTNESSDAKYLYRQKREAESDLNKPSRVGVTFAVKHVIAKWRTLRDGYVKAWNKVVNLPSGSKAKTVREHITTHCIWKSHKKTDIADPLLSMLNEPQFLHVPVGVGDESHKSHTLCTEHGANVPEAQ